MRDGNPVHMSCKVDDPESLNEGWPECGMETNCCLTATACMIFV